MADQSKRFRARLFVAVWREVVVVVVVVVSDNSIGQVMSNPPASPVHAQITGAEPCQQRLSRGVSAAHSRDPWSVQADIKLGPNTARPRCCIAAE